MNERGGLPHANSAKTVIESTGQVLPAVRRHHSFTLGVKGGSRRQSLFKQGQRTSSALSPVNSAVNGDSDSFTNFSSTNKNNEKDASGSENSNSLVKKKLALVEGEDMRPMMMVMMMTTT